MNIITFASASIRMERHQITELCVSIKKGILMLMHIVAVTKLVLVPQGMILLSKEFYHPGNKTYVLKDKGKNSFRISNYS